MNPSPTSPKLDDPDPDVWIVTLRGTEGTPSVQVRIRRLLKVAARLGLRCTRVASLEPEGGNSTETRKSLVN